jgi:hypothetical protein
VSYPAKLVARLIILLGLLVPGLACAAHLMASHATLRVGETVLVKAKDVPVFAEIDWRHDPGLEQVAVEGRALTLRGTTPGDWRVTLLLAGKPSAEVAIKVTPPAPLTIAGASYLDKIEVKNDTGRELPLVFTEYIDAEQVRTFQRALTATGADRSFSFTPAGWEEQAFVQNRESWKVPATDRSGMHAYKLVVAAGDKSIPEQTLTLDFLVKEKVLNVARVRQEGSLWCWAAGAQAILNYQGRAIYACDLVNIARRGRIWAWEKDVDCCKEGPGGADCNFALGANSSVFNLLTGPSTADVLKQQGFTAKVTEGAMTSATVMRNIDDDTPFMIGVAPHFIVARGYRAIYGSGTATGAHRLYMHIMDPLVYPHYLLVDREHIAQAGGNYIGLHYPWVCSITDIASTTPIADQSGWIDQPAGSIVYVPFEARIQGLNKASYFVEWYSPSPNLKLLAEREDGRVAEWLGTLPGMAAVGAKIYADSTKKILISEKTPKQIDIASLPKLDLQAKGHPKQTTVNLDFNDPGYRTRVEFYLRLLTRFGDAPVEVDVEKVNFLPKWHGYDAQGKDVAVARADDLLSDKMKRGVYGAVFGPPPMPGKYTFYVAMEDPAGKELGISNAVILDYANPLSVSKQAVGIGESNTIKHGISDAVLDLYRQTWEYHPDVSVAPARVGVPERQVESAREGPKWARLKLTPKDPAKASAIGFEVAWNVVPADPGLSIVIEGKNAAKRNETVPLAASVKAARGPVPPLKYTWSAEGKSLGDRATAGFVADKPGSYTVMLRVQAQIGQAWRDLGETRHTIVVAQGDDTTGGAKPVADLKSQAEAKYQWLKDSLVYLEALKEYDRKTFASFKNGVTSAMARQFVAENPRNYDDKAKLPENCADITSDVLLQADCYAAKQAGCGATVGEARNAMNRYGQECSATLAKGCQVVRSTSVTKRIDGRDVKVEEPVTDCDLICAKARACDKAFSTYSGRAGYANDVQGYINQNYLRCLGEAGSANGKNQKELARKIEQLPESLPFKRWQEYKAYNDWAGYLAAVDKVKQEFALPEPIPSPPVLAWKYTSPCGGGASVAPPKDEAKGDLNVSLSGPGIGTNLKPGDSASLDAKVSNGKPPYRYTWSGASGSGPKGTAKPAWAGDWTVLVKVTDADGKTGEAKTTFSVRPLALKLSGAQGKVFYGRSYRINASGLEPIEPPKPPPGPDPCAGHVRTNNPFDECNTITVDPDKAVSVSGNAVIPTVPIAPAEVSGPVPPVTTKPAAGAGGKYRYVWQAEPAVEFNAPTTDKPTTLVTYTRMGQVKLWCEAHTFVEGAWHTLGECEQVSVDVVAPAFTFSFTPPDGQGRIGQEVRAVLGTKPEVAAKYLDYRWFDPPSSNRMEHSQNASDIGFKIKDAKPVPLKVLVRVPHYGDTIADLTASYTGVAYDVQIGAPRLNGPQLQQWVCDTQLGRAKDCGMKDIPQGQFVTFQDIYLKAIIAPTPEAPRYRWTVAPSGSCGLPGFGSELHLNCGNTGTYTVNLEVADADGNILGKAESSVSVSVRMEQTKPGKAPDSGADAKVREAKQAVEAGRLDPGIDLVTQAVNLDPKHAEAGALRDRWQRERQQVVQYVGDARRAMERGELGMAGAALASAKTLHPKHPLIAEAERELEAKKNAKATQDKRVAQLAEAVRGQIRDAKYEAALASLNELRPLDRAKADALAKELAVAAKRAATAAEQKRDFQQSGKLFEIAKQADPSDIEAARGVNNAPVYAQRLKEVRAWQSETRAALDRGDYDSAKARLYDIKNWESTLPGTPDKLTGELQARHDKEFAAYQKAVDDLKNRAEKAMLASKCDDARKLLDQVSAKRPVDQERKWLDMMQRELAARAQRGECAGAGGLGGVGAVSGVGGTLGVPAGANTSRAGDGETSLSMDQAVVEPGKPFTVRFTASPKLSKYSYVPLVPSSAPHGDAKAINAVRLMSQDIQGKTSLSYWAPTTPPAAMSCASSTAVRRRRSSPLAFEVRAGAGTTSGGGWRRAPTWPTPGGRDYTSPPAAAWAAYLAAAPPGAPAAALPAPVAAWVASWGGILGGLLGGAPLGAKPSGVYPHRGLRRRQRLAARRKRPAHARTPCLQPDRHASRCPATHQVPGGGLPGRWPQGRAQPVAAGGGHRQPGSLRGRPGARRDPPGGQQGACSSTTMPRADRRCSACASIPVA